MTDILGGGERIIYNSRLIVTGTSKLISQLGFELFNDTVYSNLTFLYQPCPCIVFDSSTGIFEFQTTGVLTLVAAIGVDAQQASVELEMIPEFNFGAGWVVGVPRKETFVAIQKRQLTWGGEINILKGSQMRFNFKANSGNICFETVTLDPGGPLEAVLPATVLYIKITRRILHKSR